MRLALLLATIFWSLVAMAHGKADNHLQIMIIDDRIKMNIVVDMRVLGQVDANLDGYASLAEISEHRERLQDWINRTFVVTDARGRSGEVVFSDITSDLNIASDRGDRVDHARILQTLRFSGTVRRLGVDLSALKMLVPELRVSVIDAATGMRYRPGEPGKAQVIALPGGKES